MATPITKTVIELPLKSAQIEIIKQALLTTNKNTKLIFKTQDNKFYEISGSIKPSKV